MVWNCVPVQIEHCLSAPLPATSISALSGSIGVCARNGNVYSASMVVGASSSRDVSSTRAGAPG